MSLLKSGDKLHWIKNLYRRWRDGAGCCDVYSLYNYLAPKIEKSLIVYKKNSNGTPMGITAEEWDKILDDMIFAFHWANTEESWFNEDRTLDERAQRGYELFGKYFRNLWL